MADYDAATYGDRIADTYDELYGRQFESETTAALLAELAGRGPALELGIGTGRIALPLIARGIPVHGIDASEAMLARLRQKPGGTGIPVTVGDFATVPVEGRFSLVYVVFNTFFALLTQEDQVACFGHVAEHLTDRGVFVIEAFVPDPSRFDRGQRVQLTHVDAQRLILNSALHDPVAQRTTSQHVVISESGIRLYPVQLRYAWPAELDLMARLAGLRLRERWSGWRKEPFSASSPAHVSVYARG